MPLPGFSETSFTYEDVTRTVFRRGRGPGVVVMHEVDTVGHPTRAALDRVLAFFGEQLR